MSDGIPQDVLSLLSGNHWITEDYSQRMTEADWRKILLANADGLEFKGRNRQLQAQSIGFGVV